MCLWKSNLRLESFRVLFRRTRYVLFDWNIFVYWVNYFKVKSGLSQEQWEEKGWINNQDPRGWFQWYCRYFLGRRTDDDERQIQRWNNFCGEKGRWRNYIYSKIFNKGTTIEDLSFSLAVRQSLLHWGYMINNDDFDMWKLKNRS